MEVEEIVDNKLYITFSALGELYTAATLVIQFAITRGCFSRHHSLFFQGIARQFTQPAQVLPHLSGPGIFVL